jgi:hypothetical protein
MSRTAAKFTQADVSRAIRAAKQAGAGCVEMRPDGTIVVQLSPQSTGREPERVEDEEEAVF